MPKLSVCIEMFWMELPYPERVRRVAALGFEAYEFWGWRSKDLDAIRAAQEEMGLHLAGILAEPAMSLTTPGNHAELVQGMRDSVQAARSLDCSSLIVTTGNVVPGESYEITRRRVVRKLKAMAQVAADAGMIICLEPLNPFVDHPGYWLTTMAQAGDIVEEVDSPGLTILYDMYHQQITEGNLLDNLHRHLPRIGHIHTAGVPGRHELVGSENDWGVLFRAIDEAGYQGYVGLEFRPTIGEEAALRQCLELR
ncbi:MAG: hydroxypyruvate isomerase [Caldilineae bacterium]|nr:MAG: hydroxypyruvate isomerase [Caldilineae bacterium]